MSELGIQSLFVTNGISNGYYSKPSEKLVCDCCPYGYHIDLDFVKFCEKMAIDSTTPSAGKRQRRERRRQTQSMEVLLGLASPVFWNFQSVLPQIPQEESSALTEAPLPPRRFSTISSDNDALKKAVQDFEATLERTSKSERRKETMCRKISPIRTQSEDHVDSSQRLVPDTLHLKTIRAQMAASLERIKDLEEQVNIIPNLKRTITELQNEKEQLLGQLISQNKDKKDVGIMCSFLAGKQSLKLEKNVYKRDIGVTCTVTTREVGVTPILLKLRSISSEIKPETSEKSVTTDFEKTLLKDSWKTSKLTQTQSEILKIVEKRDFGIQTEASKKDVGALIKPKTADSFTECKVILKDCGVSEDKISDKFCDKCDVKTRSVGVGWDNVKVAISPGIGLANRSKSFDFNNTPTRKLTRSIGSNTIMPLKKLTASKFTSTVNLKPSSRNIGISTETPKFVSTAVGDDVVLVRSKLDERRTKEQKDSKIPRPTSLKIKDRSPTISLAGTPTFENSNRLTTSTHVAEESRQETPEPEVTVVRRRHPIQQEIDETQKRLSHDLNLQDSASGIDRCSGLFDDYPFDYDEHYDSQESNRNSQMFPDSTLFQPIQEKPREKLVPSKEMKAAFKVVNDALLKNPNGLPKHARTASNIIQQEWFKISSTESANPLDVEDYLDHFEALSSTLLAHIVNMVDKNGNTAMHYAVSHGNFDIVSILLDSKVCNINKHNAAGYTCIMLVSLAQVRSDTHRQVVRRLFQLGDVNSRAKQHGQTALMLAVSHGRKDMVQLLLEAGADPNIQDDDGSTALMCAAEHGHLAIVQLILNHPDTDVTIVDCDGSSALAIAMEAGNKDIGVLLYAKEHFSSATPRGGSPFQTHRRRSKPPSSPVSKSPRPSK